MLQTIGFITSMRDRFRLNRGGVAMGALGIFGTLACAAIAGAAEPTSASRAYDLPAFAAGEDHLWWAVRRKRPEVPGAVRAGTTPEYLLMHHASVEPAPTERFVLTLGAEPEALAADGSNLVMVMPPAGERERMVLSLGTRRNDAIGHWYTEPRGGPRVLRPLDSRGEILDAEMAGGKAYLLRRIDADDGRVSYELRSIDAEASGGDWSLIPLPDNPEEPNPAGVFADLADARLYRDGAELGIVRLHAGALHTARLSADGWIEETLALEFQTPARGFQTPARGFQTPARGFQTPAREFQTPARGSQPPALGSATINPDAALVTLTRFGGALVVLLREPASDARDTTDVATAEAPPHGRANEGTIRLLTVRQGRASDWARFPEPDRPYALAAFGPGIALFCLDDEGRGVVRSIGPTRSAPDEPVVLMPPGFASARWVHLPILAALSVAFVLTALLFGSDSYLQSRPGQASPPSDPPSKGNPQRRVGAPLSRRFLAFVADCIPGFVVSWIVLGGSPLALIDHPISRPDIVAALPAGVVLLIGWAIGLVGDTVFGRSPGKRLVGLSVVARDGGPATTGRRLARGLLSLFSVASPLVMLVALVHPWCDGPAEMLSGTSVVEDASSAPNA